MKRVYCLNIILIFLFIFAIGANDVTAKTLYDDFSGDFLDSSKWDQGEFVREVVNEKLVSKVSTEAGGARNRTIFQNSGSIYAIQADITPVNSSLGGGSDVAAFIRLEGIFYNAQPSGGVTGNVWAGVTIIDRGNGLEVAYTVAEALDDNWETWTDWASDTISTGLSYGQTYTLKIEYNAGCGQIHYQSG